MRKLSYSVCLSIFLLLVINIPVYPQLKSKARNWLMESYNQVYGQEIAFPDLLSWRRTQRLEIDTRIAELPDSVKANVLKTADEALSYKWPTLPASLYLDYKFTGTRTNFEQLVNERRKKLAHLVAGELIRKDKRYLPQIVNGIWLSLEESTWVAPAHIVVQSEGADLPNVDFPYIDLHASRTGANLAMIYFLLQNELERYSKVLNKRIESEMKRRIFDPYLLSDKFFWSGSRGNAVNNWNAFNNTNCMQAALLMMGPGESLNRFTKLLFASADRFVNQYPADGGCDEGPSYWDMAGGKIIKLFSLVTSASGGKMSFSDKDLLHQMGNYTYNMQIADQYLVNFADALAVYTQNPQSVFAFGELFNDQKLKQYGSFLFQSRKRQLPVDDITDFIETVKVYNSLIGTPAVAPYPAYSILPELQVFNARAKEGSTDGLFLAAKGGHNEESHNHNDVGNFIVYADGKPLLIDAGVGTYTSKTFSAQRYELWNVQSAWHNTPSINGFDQKNGRSFHAKDFKFTPAKTRYTLSLDIASAYPQQAGINYWKREFNFFPQSNRLRITESYALKQFLKASTLHLICAKEPSIKNNKVILGDSGYEIVFDPTQLIVTAEQKEMDDPRIRQIWGAKIYRLNLQIRSKKVQETIHLDVKPSI